MLTHKRKNPGRLTSRNLDFRPLARCGNVLTHEEGDSEHHFQLVKYLDQFVVGQATAKKVLSVA